MPRSHDSIDVAAQPRLLHDKSGGQPRRSSSVRRRAASRATSTSTIRRASMNSFVTPRSSAEAIAEGSLTLWRLARDENTLAVADLDECRAWPGRSEPRAPSSVPHRAPSSARAPTGPSCPAGAPAWLQAAGRQQSRSVSVAAPATARAWNRTPASHRIVQPRPWRATFGGRPRDHGIAPIGCARLNR